MLNIVRRCRAGSIGWPRHPLLRNVRGHRSHHSTGLPSMTLCWRHRLALCRLSRIPRYLTTLIWSKSLVCRHLLPSLRNWTTRSTKPRSWRQWSPTSLLRLLRHWSWLRASRMTGHRRCFHRPSWYTRSHRRWIVRNRLKQCPKHLCHMLQLDSLFLNPLIRPRMCHDPLDGQSSLVDSHVVALSARLRCNLSQLILEFVKHVWYLTCANLLESWVGSCRARCG